jgi:ParB-like chromosome segregation protein Spo0J
LKKERMARKIADLGISVRATEELIKNIGTKTQANEKKEKVTVPEIESAQSALSTALGTKVLIAGDLIKGKILLSYYNQDQLQSLYDFLMTCK